VCKAATFKSVHHFHTILGLALAAWLASPAALSAAQKLPNGSAIYQRHCVKCHGKNGEGVKGKYDEALVGDWSVERLARYIDKSMPEGAPHRVDAKESEAVARFIHDAFYSREAQVRNNPPRVELARLTNRQYQTSVADLLKPFMGTDEPVKSERGLSAAYYNSRNTRSDQRAFERVEGRIDYDFGEGSPDKDKLKAEEFSIRWAGSLLAEETGEYEFILKTPNGSRLWINSTQNNPDTPLIDAWVASPSNVEHRATLKLLGGRAYPIRLEFFKFKDKTASVSLQWKPPHGAQEVIPARNLSPVRTAPTFVVNTPFPPDDRSVGYERGVSVSKSWDEATTRAALEVADYVVKRLDQFTRSRPTDGDRAAKVEAFCRQFVEAAFRRPLTAEDQRLYVTGPLQSTLQPESAVKRVILLALKSPRFLYLGLERANADGFEVASRLSYALWDSLPDRELLRLAAEGKLPSREEIARQARRMLADPRARAKLREFLQHWLQMNEVEDLTKDDQLFPGFTPQIIADLRTSLTLFVEDVLWSEASDYRRLLLEDDLYVNERLAKFYGIPAPQTNDFVKVSLDPQQRSGVVTHPYLLAAFSYNKTTSPIHRGVFLTRNIVGRALKPPPVAVAFNEGEFDPKLTMREKVEKLTQGVACQGCHSVINPLGFSLENYDAVGRFRTQEGSRPVDAVSEYVTDEGQTITFKNARDLAQFAVGSDHAHRGFIEQLFHKLVKQPVLAYGPDAPERLRQSFIQSGFNIRELVIEIAALAAMPVAELPPAKATTSRPRK